MSVPTQAYTWNQGEDLTISLIYKEGPTGAEAPVDLTGWKLRMDVVDSSGRIFTFNSDDIAESGVDTVGPSDNEAVLGSDGSISITVPRSLTLSGGPIYARMQTGNSVFNYDIFLRNTANKQWPILRGTIQVLESYTQWA